MVKIFRDAGFDEYNNPNSTIIGTISYLAGPQGPGRIRTDIVGDVFFDLKNDTTKKFKQGQRVMVLDVKKKQKSKLPFMFESPWVATDVQPLTKVKKHTKKEISVVARKKILKEYGTSLKGFKTQQKPSKPFELGQIVYGFYSGVYRIVQFKGKVAICEEVYNAKLSRATGATNSWLTNFCRPLQPSVAKILKD